MQVFSIGNAIYGVKSYIIDVYGGKILYGVSEEGSAFQLLSVLSEKDSVPTQRCLFLTKSKRLFVSIFDAPASGIA